MLKCRVSYAQGEVRTKWPKFRQAEEIGGLARKICEHVRKYEASSDEDDAQSQHDLERHGKERAR